MIDGLTHLWNSLTGGKLVSRQEYIEFVFGKMDQDKEGKVTKENFIKNSSNYTFETLKIHDYLNSDESEVLKVFLDKLFRIARTTKKQEDQSIIKKLGQLENQLQFCMSYICQN
jgi:hypothetical protein